MKTKLIYFLYQATTNLSRVFYPYIIKINHTFLNVKINKLMYFKSFLLIDSIPVSRNYLIFMSKNKWNIISSQIMIKNNYRKFDPLLSISIKKGFDSLYYKNK